MSVYEGRTVKEAFSKALAKTQRVSSPPRKLVMACDGLADDVEEVGTLLRHFESDLRRFQNHMTGLERESRNLLLRLGFDVALITIPIARVVKARGLMRAIRSAIRNRQQLGKLDLALNVLAEVVGFTDLIVSIRRMREIPSELRHDLAQSDQLSRDIEGMRRRLQTVASEYARLGCRKLPSDTPMS